MKWVLLICLLLTSATALPEIYRYVDTDGTVTYSDQPNATSKSVQLPPANIAVQPVTQSKTPNKGSETSAPKKAEYTRFEISSPTDQASLFNLTELPIQADVYPALEPDDKIQFYYDGQAVDSPSEKTSITLPKVQNNSQFLVRGSHTIYAVILNKDGDTIKTTPTITIFLQYTSVNNLR